MAKTRSRPRGEQARAKRRPPPSFYERNQRWLFLAGLVTIFAFVLVATRGGPDEVENTSSAFTGSDFHSLVADPSNPGRIYAGGHQAVSVSSDGGRSWREIESLRGADAMGWAFGEDTIYLGGHPGISTSADGGKMFRRANQGLPATDIHSLGASGVAIYAGSPQVGLIVSTDRGDSWELRNAVAGRSFMGRILVDPNDPQHLIAPDLASGVVESPDGGASWRRLGGLASVQWVSWDPADIKRIVASGGGRAVESRDGGQTWRDLSLPSGATIIELDPKNPRQLYAGAHDGERVTVRVSSDGGKSWTRP